LVLRGQNRVLESIATCLLNAHSFYSIRVPVASAGHGPGPHSFSVVLNVPGAIVRAPSDFYTP